VLFVGRCPVVAHPDQSGLCNSLVAFGDLADVGMALEPEGLVANDHFGSRRPPQNLRSTGLQRLPIVDFAQLNCRIQALKRASDRASLFRFFGWAARGGDVWEAPVFPTLSFGDQELTPQEMSARSAQVAGAMAVIGLKEGDTIALMLRNEPALMDIMLAARQLGLYFTPLNWHFKSEEAAYIIRDCGAKALFTHTDLFQQVRDGVPPDVPVLALQPHPLTVAAYNIQEPARLIPDGTRDWAALVAEAVPLATSATIPRGMIAYTSGTTGRPKGVLRVPPSPEGASAFAESMSQMFQRAWGLTPDARCLISAPLYHSAPCISSLVLAQFGAWLRLEPKFDAQSTLSTIERLRVTHPYLVPTMYVRLLRLPEDVRYKYDLSSVKFVSSTGAPCAPDVKRAMIDWWGDVINETYASSETGCLTAISSVEARSKPGSAGRPLEGVSIKVLDDDGNEVAAGVMGKIYARHFATPLFTYINRDGDRKAVEHDGYVTVGDIGYLDDGGYLYVSDRRTDLVLSGGVNIYPAEIELALIGMPGVADCAVFGVPDAEFGQSLVAAVQTQDEVFLTAQQVRHFLSKKLANFKVPRVVEFRNTLPREDTGKIFKRRLQEEYASRCAGELIE
jgi:long-chain acyl-CoA synthetase